jgi:predicted RNase H-like HicB family nuclease
MEKKVLRWDCRVLIQPAADLPGQWVAHCLQGDVMSQGSSPAEARDSLVEAFQIVFEHEVEHGRNPFERRSAPEECWAAWKHVMQNGRPVSFAEAEQRATAAVAYIATMMTVLVEVIDHQKNVVIESDDATDVPPAWMIASSPNMLAYQHSA